MPNKKVFMVSIFASILLGVFGAKTFDYFAKHRKIDSNEKKAVEQAALNQLTALTSGIKPMSMPKTSFMEKIAPKYVKHIIKDSPDLAKAGFNDDMILTFMKPVLGMVFDEFVR